MSTLRSAALIASALASAMGCYTVSLHAAGERSAVVAAHDQITRDLSEMRLLRAELRTRSRLPELQRWNEEVLALAPPRAEQLVANPVQLASYAAPTAPAAAPGPAAPATVQTVVRDAPAPVPTLRRATFTPRAAADLGADAVLAGGAAPAGAATLQVSFRKAPPR